MRAAHQTTLAEVLKRYPETLVEAPNLQRARVAKFTATQRARLAEDPTFAEEKRRQGKRLSDFRKGLPTNIQQEIHSRSTESFLKNSTPEARKAAARKGHQALEEKHPGLSAKAWARAQHVATEFWRSAKGKEFASKRAFKIWADPAHREKISKANSAAAVNGRIPVRFNKIRPTRLEARFLLLLNGWDLPFKYVGDGSFRIPTPGGLRHWRNPDFIHTSLQAVLLLDSYLGQHHLEEVAEYQRAGWAVLRINVSELEDKRWLKRRLLRFLRGLQSSPSEKQG